MKIKFLIPFIAIICMIIHSQAKAGGDEIICSENENNNFKSLKRGVNGAKRISKHTLQIKWQGGYRLFKDTLLEDPDNGVRYYYCGYNKKAKVHLIEAKDDIMDSVILMSAVTGKTINAGHSVILSPDYSKFLASRQSSGKDAVTWIVKTIKDETLWEGINAITVVSDSITYMNAYLEDPKWSPKGELQATHTCAAFVGTKQEKKTLVTLKEQDGEYQWLPNIECPSIITATESDNILPAGDVVDCANILSEMELLADKGNVDAQKKLGYLYYEGDGVTQDKTKAARWLHKAAEQGDAGAQVSMGYMYDNGDGVIQDKTEAVKWYRKAAEQGHDNAQAGLGYMYEHGEGVILNKTEAVKWYRKAAEQGNAYAENFLGFAYKDGDGVTQDKTEAAKWLHKAAAHGYADAQRVLGYMYKSGEGVKQDKTEAAKWFLKSADLGDAYAQYALGIMYRDGDGVTQNKVESEKWLSKAAEQNVPSFTAKEQEATNVITSEDLEDCGVLLGKKKVKEFQSFITDVKEQADNGDLEDGINYAGIMHNRFVCREDEILGEQPWETIIENGKGQIVQHTTRKTVPSLKDHPKAFVALKDAVSAYTQIADKDLGSHMILGRYYADYNDVLGYSQEGYLLVSQIYEAICHQKKVTEINQGRCKTLDRLKLRYKNLVSQKDRNELDQQATVWAQEFLENNMTDRFLRD